jgi:hypothetical protein
MPTRRGIVQQATNSLPAANTSLAGLLERLNQLITEANRTTP